MSVTAQSEMRTVSEAADLEFQKEQEIMAPSSPSQKQAHHQAQLQQQQQQQSYDTSKKSSGGTSPRVGGTGSRSGSQFLPRLHNAMLPSKIAIIVGLCQVAVGGAMVLTGILAIRYQSYMFHYGTGLWAGLLSAITGMLGAMCTKRGVPKPSWLCGGRKWQIHVFLLAIILSLSSVVLLAIFSTSGLLQDAKTVMAVDIDYQNQLDELLDSKNTSGIAINTILLLLSILQVLLCFSSLGIAVRVMFKTRGTLLSSKGSTGSEIAIRDNGGEYHARKNHLIHWLGHQRPNIIPLGLGGGLKYPQKMQKYPPTTFVAIQPVMYPSPRRMVPHMMPMPHPQLIVQHPQQYYTPAPQLIPICAVHGQTPTPSIIIPAPHKTRSRRSGTPVSSIASLSLVPNAVDHQRRRRRGHHAMMRHNNGGGHSQMHAANPSLKSFQTQTYSQSSKAPSVISAAKTESEKNNELEITEVDVSRTYTGLDRTIADDYINSMSRSNCNSRKASSTISVSVEEEADESDNEHESTRM